MDSQPAIGDSIARDYQEAEINGKQHQNGHGAFDEGDPENMLKQIKTSGTGSVTISSDLFERLYLQPKIVGPPLKHPLQKILGNPTPLGIIGFEMSLMPITMQLMEWRQSNGYGSANNADVIFYGGILMWVSGLLEFFLGNTFPFLVFMSFGSFYAAYGSQLIPWFGTYASFSDDPINDPAAGLSSAVYASDYAHYWTAFTILMFFFYVCTFRTNVLFVLLFTCITPAAGCIAGIFYELANGNTERAHNCQLTAGALLFCACCFGWYLFAGLILPTVDFPLPVPLGDLSTIVPGLTDLTGDTGAETRKERNRRLNLARFGRKKNDDMMVDGDAV